MEQWLELRSGYLAGNIVTHTQVFDPEKPVSLLFDACVTIDKLCEGTDCGCGGLGWKRTYRSNEKYMCRGDNSWLSNNEGYHFCPYWSCVSWTTWHEATHLALFQKDTTTPNCSQGTCNPVNTVLPRNWFGSYVLGSIRPSFYLLLLRQGENLGVPMYKQRKAGILITCLEGGFLP
jgi:hypothetical protein